MIHVLLIEDNKGDIALIDLAFEEMDLSYQLVVKQNGKEAVDYIKDADAGKVLKPEMIILDLNLPYVNGFDILSKIKKSIFLKDTSVIIFSSSSSEEDETRAFKLGAAAYFVKPIEYDAYISTVKSFFVIPNEHTKR